MSSSTLLSKIKTLGTKIDNFTKSSSNVLNTYTKNSTDVTARIKTLSSICATMVTKCRRLVDLYKKIGNQLVYKKEQLLQLNKSKVGTSTDAVQLQKEIKDCNAFIDSIATKLEQNQGIIAKLNEEITNSKQVGELDEITKSLSAILQLINNTVPSASSPSSTSSTSPTSSTSWSPPSSSNGWFSGGGRKRRLTRKRGGYKYKKK